MKKNKREKICNFIGVLVGVVIIITGFVTIATPARTFSTDSAREITFGADFYTEQYNATRITTLNTARTANNIRELGEKLALYCGLTFVFSGCLVSLNYGKKLLCAPEQKAEYKESAFNTPDVSVVSNISAVSEPDAGIKDDSKPVDEA